MNSQDHRTACMACAKSSEEAYLYEALHDGLPLCSKCAKRVCKAFYLRHGGYAYYEQEPKRGFKKARIPETMRWEVFNRDGFACRKCRASRFLRADHVVAESKGGPTTIENLQTLCQSCNSAKGTA